MLPPVGQCARVETSEGLPVKFTHIPYTHNDNRKTMFFIHTIMIENLSKTLVTIATYNIRSTMKSDFSCDMMNWDGKHLTEFLPVGKARKTIFRQAAGQQV